MNDRLYRSRDDRVLGGVAGGLAEHFDLDPSLVRIVWAVLILLTGGLLLVLYVIMWIVVPEGDGLGGPAAAVPPWPVDPNAPPASPEAQAAQAEAAQARAAAAGAREDARRARLAARAERRAARRARGENPAAVVIGAILILIGGLFFLREFLPQLDLDLFWPLFLVGLGILVLVLAFRRDSGTNGSPT